jgi:hypothetical protein
MSEAESVMAAVTKFLDEIEIEYELSRPDTSNQRGNYFRIACGIRLENGNYRGEILYAGEDHCLVFYAISPTVIPKRRRRSVAEFIAWANSGMMIGNIELNCRTGEVRFKTSIDCDGTPLNYSLLRGLLYRCFGSMDDFQPAIESVVKGESTPEEANQKVRNKEDGNTAENGVE